MEDNVSPAGSSPRKKSFLEAARGSDICEKIPLEAVLEGAESVEAGISKEEGNKELLQSVSVEVKISEADILEARSGWKWAVIVRIDARFVAFMYLKNRLIEIWLIHGAMELIGLGDGFFAARFELESEFERALHGGPWFLGSSFISVRIWEPDFSASPEKVGACTIVWVSLPRFPLEYYSSNILKKIGNSLGSLLKIDARTDSSECGSYARPCVQVKTDNPVVTKLKIGSFTQSIDYEGMKICVEYSCLGNCSSLFIPGYSCSHSGSEQGSLKILSLSRRIVLLIGLLISLLILR